jgi:hypothetical protein
MSPGADLVALSAPDLGPQRAVGVALQLLADIPERRLQGGHAGAEGDPVATVDGERGPVAERDHFGGVPIHLLPPEFATALDLGVR